MRLPKQIMFVVGLVVLLACGPFSPEGFCEVTFGSTQIDSTTIDLGDGKTAEAEASTLILKFMDGVTIHQMADVLANTCVKAPKMLKPLDHFLTHLFKRLSEEGSLDSPRLAMAKLIKSNLLDRIALHSPFPSHAKIIRPENSNLPPA